MNICYSAIIGSHLYGTATPTSDVDIRGCFIPPIKTILGFQKLEQVELTDSDTVYYSLKKFFDLLVNGNTQAIECLFSNQIMEIDDVGQMILDNRNLFLSKRLYRHIRGFAFAEWRKVKNVSLKLKGGKDKVDAIEQLCSQYHLRRYQRDSIIEMIEQMTGEVIKSEETKSLPEGRRRQETEVCGYSAKNAAHTIRLLEQGIELLTKGYITFPRPEAHLLLKLKNGEIPFEEIDEVYQGLDEDFEQLYYSSTVLPEQPNMDAIFELYKECLFVGKAI